MSEETKDNINSLSFRVDSGLIERLGRELVGRAETAVSELIKNTYDADAKHVEAKFIDTDKPGGTLVIDDDGVGMDIFQLRDGFMTISSTDKIHNPQSKKFKRSRAGKKGIGRFATQRLGKKLTIITQTLEAEKAIQLVIEWDAYKIDTELSSIINPISYIDKAKEEGTTLIIESLRESWTEGDMKRVFRYVSDLLQPNYISDRSKEIGLASQTDESFDVKFYEIQDGQSRKIADPDKMLFSKALATIEGFIDKDHNGFCKVITSLDVKDTLMPVLNDKVYSEDLEEGQNPSEVKPDSKYRRLSELHFKVYYFIYQREKYYTNISKLELASVQKLSLEQGGIRLYRNGFRVLPYGEPNDDWLNIDRRYYNYSGTNIPFGNRNFFGFVEIIDPDGKLFQETASREGLIENEAYQELTHFLNNALETARAQLRYAVEKAKKEVYGKKQTEPKTPEERERTTIEKLDYLEKSVNEIISSSDAATDSQDLKKQTQRIVQELRSEFLLLLDELGMVRVLAGLGLTIGEFTHEVIQFSPSIMGDLSVLSNQELNSNGINSLENLKRTIQLFITYTSYFNATVSANVSRELRPQDLEKVVGHFKAIIEGDLNKSGINFTFEPYGYDLVTLPMHSSEWSSILFNFYTNSKKAIKRKGGVGELKVVVGKEDGKIYLEFADNGDGIPEENIKKVFEPFFTTSSPMGFDASEDEKLTGTGLGLKIVKDIVQTYGGAVEVVKPETGYATCFRIELPMATLKQREEYGL